MRGNLFIIAFGTYSYSIFCYKTWISALEASLKSSCQTGSLFYLQLFVTLIWISVGGYFLMSINSNKQQYLSRLVCLALRDNALCRAVLNASIFGSLSIILIDTQDLGPHSAHSVNTHLTVFFLDHALTRLVEQYRMPASLVHFQLFGTLILRAPYTVNTRLYTVVKQGRWMFGDILVELPG